MIEEKRKKYVKSSFKLQESKQEPIHHTSHENPQKKLNKEPIFNQLFFQTFEQGIPLPGKHPISKAFEHKPNFVKYYVMYVNSNIQHSNLNENPPEICFWQRESIKSNDLSTKLTELIQTQFSSLIFHKEDKIDNITNKPKSKILQDVKNVQGHQLVYHYIGNDADRPTEGQFNLINSENESLFLSELIENCGNYSIFIFDCDNSGSLLTDFLREKSKSEKTKNFDSIFFFSCSEKETMPRSTDYPVDFFTSCLTSPSRVALLWHSRHYFCFQSGCLQPLPTFFVEDMSDENPKITKLLNELDSVLRCTVESMAYENMEPELFVKLFRTNNTLSKLCVNYFLACRILSYFNVHPLSYPELPDLNECSQWQTFDLRLDATLFLLRENDACLSYHNFLSQTLLSMKAFNESISSKKIINVPSELSFVPEILNDDELSSSACDVLAKYFDLGPDAVYCSLYYPIPQTLFRLLHQNIIDNRNKSF